MAIHGAWNGFCGSFGLGRGWASGLTERNRDRQESDGER
jgi:hypothetical protein